MIEYFADFDPDTGRVFQCIVVENPYQGTFIEAGRTYIGLPAPIDWHTQPSATHEMRIVDGAAQWVDTASLTKALNDAIAAIDKAADAMRTAAIGDPARAIEYQRAELQARAYAAAGYTGTVPRCVKAWATPKGWTGQQAADDIIATAERWYEALDTIRELRLAAKEAARGIAANPEGTAGAIYAVQATFLSTLHALMQGIA